MPRWPEKPVEFEEPVEKPVVFEVPAEEVVVENPDFKFDEPVVEPKRFEIYDHAVKMPIVEEKPEPKKVESIDWLSKSQQLSFAEYMKLRREHGFKD